MFEHSGAVIVCSLVLATISLSILNITGRVVMHEHLSAKDYITSECSTLDVMDYGRTSCTYTETVGTGDDSITVTRYSHFRCVRIDVSYEDLDGVRKNGTIFGDVFMVSDDTQKCSYATCGRSERSSNAKVLGFLNRWGNVRSPSTAQCFYDPTNLQQLIATKHYTYTQALHAVLWPASICILSLTVLIAACICENK